MCGYTGPVMTERDKLVYYDWKEVRGENTPKCNPEEIEAALATTIRHAPMHDNCPIPPWDAGQRDCIYTILPNVAPTAVTI